MNVIIIDDDCLVAGALKTILEMDPDITVPAVGNDGTDAISLYRNWKPDVLLMDIRMKEINGLNASGAILTEFPDAKILLLTTFSDDEYIIKALQLGAKGYLLKQDYQSIVPAIKAVALGQSVFGGEITAKIPELLTRTQKFNYEDYDITQKEFSIIQLVADGLSNKEIAARLFLSEGTVRNYLSQILEKLELRDRTQLAAFYLTRR